MNDQPVEQSARAALFDLRTVIALLFGAYGVILTVLGATTTGPEELDKSGGININLWTGIGMLVVAALFVLWQRLRPAVAGERSDEPG